jgi:hypothetical protein
VMLSMNNHTIQQKNEQQKNALPHAVKINAYY